MGVNFLWQHFLSLVKKSSWKRLKVLAIVADLSYWLHKALAQPTVAMKLEYDKAIKMNQKSFCRIYRNDMRKAINLEFNWYL